MKYQLVLRFPASSIKDYDEMVELEGTIMRSLGDLGKVDGHDLGSGEMNIFILTDHPEVAFQRITQLPGTRDFMPELKAAFRQIGEDEFTGLYPAGLSHFALA